MLNSKLNFGFKSSLFNEEVQAGAGFGFCGGFHSGFPVEIFIVGVILVSNGGFFFFSRGFGFHCFLFSVVVFVLVPGVALWWLQWRCHHRRVVTVEVSAAAVSLWQQRRYQLRLRIWSERREQVQIRKDIEKKKEKIISTLHLKVHTSNLTIGCFVFHGGGFSTLESIKLQIKI